MSNYNTGKPVPSIDPRDLDDNATNFDELLNLAVPSVNDRLGVPRKTWWQMEQDASALVSPNISALAAMVWAANKGLYFTGASAPAQFDLTAQGRTFLAAATQATQRTALALSSAAITALQTSASDATAGSILTVGAFGLGANGLSIAESALNTARPTQFMTIAAGAAGILPVNVNGYGMHVSNASAGYAYQTYNPVTGGAGYYRYQIAGVWDAAWSRNAKAGANTDITSLTVPLSGLSTAGVYGKTNILGTVTQSAGVPTGALFEKGSNATMKWIKCADGRLEITGTIADFAAGVNAFVANAITFPVAFVDTTYHISGMGQPATNADVYGHLSIASKLVGSVSLVFRNGATAQTIQSNTFMAVGRWY